MSDDDTWFDREICPCGDMHERFTCCPHRRTTDRIDHPKRLEYSQRLGRHFRKQRRQRHKALTRNDPIPPIRAGSTPHRSHRLIHQHAGRRLPGRELAA